MAHQEKLTILIVDDSRMMRDMIAQMIENSEHHSIVAKNYIEALNQLDSQKIDLILMDIEMPEVNGFELTKMIREKIEHWIPIIFLSSNDSEAYLSKGIDSGGDDYLTKPVKEVILNAKIRAMARISHMQAELDDLNHQLAKLSNIDPLTQVMNRRGLEGFIDKEWQINSRQKAELSLLMLDIDFFKPYNDNYGHLQGDKCLKEFAQVLVKSINRATDAVVRFGGEEFIIILPFTPISGARFKAQEIISLLKAAAIKHEFSAVEPFITASIGISSTSLGADNYHDLIKQADEALYLAKEKGRNQSVIFKR